MRNRRVALDDLREQIAEGLDPERKRGYVEKQKVFDLASENAGLHSGAESDHFIGIDAFVGLFAEKLLHDLLDLWDTRRAADEHDLVDLGSFEPSIVNGLLAGCDGLLNEIVDQLLELRARQTRREMFGAGGISRDERKIDLGFHR